MGEQGIQCPQCGTRNDNGSALCENCKSPLTAYSGELKGEKYQGKLAGQVALLEGRPLPVVLMSVYLALICLWFPLRAIFNAFAAHPQTNSEGTNYVASAFGAIVPILITLISLPLAGLLGWLAAAVWTQQRWSWRFSLVAIGVTAGYVVLRYADFGYPAFFWLICPVALAIFWFQPGIRGWFGLS